MCLYDYMSGVGYGIHVCIYVWMVIFRLLYRYVTMDQVPDEIGAAIGAVLPRISRAIMKVNILFVSNNYLAYSALCDVFARQ